VNETRNFRTMKSVVPVCEQRRKEMDEIERRCVRVCSQRNTTYVNAKPSYRPDKKR
jgi:hypothetical protein